MVQEDFASLLTTFNHALPLPPPCSGRKKAALLYVITYSISCATKHSSDYNVLMFGRLLGGIATSLLFSAFESWLVAEHFSKGFDEKWLGDTFSKVRMCMHGSHA